MSPLVTQVLVTEEKTIKRSFDVILLNKDFLKKLTNFPGESDEAKVQVQDF